MDNSMTKLESSTGYLQCISTKAVYNYAIYLSDIDSADNYKEITKTSYNKRLKEIETEIETAWKTQSL